MQSHYSDAHMNTHLVPSSTFYPVTTLSTRCFYQPGSRGTELATLQTCFLVLCFFLVFAHRSVFVLRNKISLVLLLLTLFGTLLLFFIIPALGMLTISDKRLLSSAANIVPREPRMFSYFNSRMTIPGKSKAN